MKKVVFSVMFLLVVAVSAQAQDLYDVFSSLPTKSDRKALVKLQSPEVQHQLWHKHLSIALSKKDVYTDEQRALIREAKKLLTVKFFTVDKKTWAGTDLHERYEDLQNRIQKAFKGQSDLYQQTFELLGDAGTLLGKLNCVEDRKAGLIKVTFSPLSPDCNCRMSIGCSDNTCGEIQGGCTEVINCGIFGSSVCLYVCGACYKGHCDIPEEL